MEPNAVMDQMMARKSIRSYTDREPTDEVVQAIVRAGRQAPFAAQLGSVLLTRDRDRIPFRAPLLFTICVDAHRLELVMAKRGWTIRTNDLSLLLFGIQDACYMAENMVTAAESLGLGSCFLGGTPYKAKKVIDDYALPPRVFPLVELAMGYPAEDPPPRPRYPLEAHLHEDRYRDFSDEDVQKAMAVMDEGYLSQDYYRKADYMVPLQGDREETFSFDDYSWTEHMGRKWGQWLGSPEQLLAQLAACGFRIDGGEDSEAGSVGFGGEDLALDEELTEDNNDTG
jgi:FMN reductase (NADPH)